MILTLDDVQIAAVLDIDDVIAAVRLAHRDLASGIATQPARPTLSISDSASVMVPMTAASSRWRLGVTKVLIDSPDNAGTDRPVQQSTVIVHDLDTGSCVAVLPGRSLTRARTAATSAVATDALARADAATLGLVGAGALARAHLDAISRVRPLTRALVWSRTGDRAGAFAQQHTTPELPVTATADLGELFALADIICTLTPSVQPIVDGRWLRPGQHLNVVGAPPRPTHREVDSLSVARSLVIVDTTDTALTESGAVTIPVNEGRITPAHLVAELGHVIDGHHPGRIGTDQITMFVSVGLAVQDLAAAHCLLPAAPRP